jgi:hypothetical protein
MMKIGLIIIFSQLEERGELPRHPVLALIGEAAGETRPLPPALPCLRGPPPWAKAMRRGAWRTPSNTCARRPGRRHGSGARRPQRLKALCIIVAVPVHLVFVFQAIVGSHQVEQWLRLQETPPVAPPPLTLGDPRLSVPPVRPNLQRYDALLLEADPETPHGDPDA